MKQEEKRKKSVERILTAALQEFGQHDYFSASINNICRNGEISKGMLFHHFKNKEELYCRCVERCIGDLCQALEENASQREAAPMLRLEESFQVRSRFFQKNPFYRQIFFTAMFDQPKGLEERIAPILRRLRETESRSLVRILETYPLREWVQPEKVADSILDFANYLSMKHRAAMLAQDASVPRVLEAQKQEFFNMLRMVLYGVVQPQ